MGPRELAALLEVVATLAAAGWAALRRWCIGYGWPVPLAAGAEKARALGPLAARWARLPPGLVVLRGAVVPASSGPEGAAPAARPSAAAWQAYVDAEAYRAGLEANLRRGMYSGPPALPAVYVPAELDQARRAELARLQQAHAAQRAEQLAELRQVQLGPVQFGPVRLSAATVQALAESLRELW